MGASDPAVPSFAYRAVIGGFGVPVASAIRRATSLSTGSDRARGHAYARYMDPAGLDLGSGSTPIHALPAPQAPDTASLADIYALGVLMYECLTRTPVLANVPAPVSVLVAAAQGKRAVVDVTQVLAGARAREATGASEAQAQARRVRVKMIELLTRCWIHDRAKRPEWHVVLGELRAVVPQCAAEGWDWR
ncbi:hypothetical protein BCR44DRAFT_1170366 [Catenaria anguillulae PL171]|uniref:Protein kinase domain-containing protein n=1 Tax=Catenaria anguillulae PL171 TaxID=765915 RepID=A0A1Y2I023_9FUNG|nr:hypothetical protein BCR44DRAFT_1170366 [Catenaria anguillulae PL171]